MDTTTGIVIVAIAIVLIVVGLLILRFRRQRKHIQVGIRAKNVVSRSGGVIADDTTGRGIDVTDIDAKSDVLLSSSNLRQPEIPAPGGVPIAVARIDARELTARGNIHFDQRSGTFYDNAQNTNAPPKDIQEDIATLFSKVQSRSVPLSQCLAEGFSLALRLQDRSLEEFCRRELEGWKPSDGGMIEVDNEHPDYRVIRAYVSRAPINTSFYGWQGNAARAVEYMERSEQFIKIFLFMPLPVVNLEELAEISVNREGIYITEGRAGELIPNASEPDLVLYQQFSVREYEKIVQAVRNELTTRLINLVREIK